MVKNIFLYARASSLLAKVKILLAVILLMLVVTVFFSFFSINQLQESFSTVIDDCTATQHFESVFNEEIVLLNDALRNPAAIRWEEFYDAQRRSEEALEGLTPRVSNIHSTLLVHAITLSLEQYHQYARELVLQIVTSGGVLDDEKIYSYSILLTRSDYICQYTASLLRHHISLSPQTYDQTKEQVAVLYRTLFVIVLVTVGFLVLIVSIVISHFFLPVHALHHAAEQIADEHFDIDDVPVMHDDELGELTVVFNRMRHRVYEAVTSLERQNRLEKELHAQEVKNIEMARAVQQVQFCLLQSQIKPHFLFNSLNAISIYAQSEHAVVTEDLLIRLSKIYRYYIGGSEDNIVALDTELSLLQDYMTLQSVRFQGEVSWVIDAEEEIREALIPKLLLQPLVENSISHGFGATGQGTVWVRAKRQGPNMIHVEICDDGCGFDLTVLDTKTEESASSLGIKNVQNRLKLFDSNSSFRIDSTPGGGTEITLTFKAQYKAE